MFTLSSCKGTAESRDFERQPPFADTQVGSAAFFSLRRRGKIYYASIYNTCKCYALIYLPLLISKNLTPLRALRFLEALIQGLSYYSNFRIHSFSASRKCAANCVRFLKSAVFKRAFDYLNIYSRKGNRNFPQRTTIWQSFALREEGEFAPLHTMCAPKKGAKSGETVAEPTVCRRAMVSPSAHGKSQASARRDFREPPFYCFKIMLRMSSTSFAMRSFTFIRLVIFSRE